MLKDQYDTSVSISVDCGKNGIKIYQVKQGHYGWRGSDNGTLKFRYISEEVKKVEGKKTFMETTWVTVEVPRERVLSIVFTEKENFQMV